MRVSAGRAVKADLKPIPGRSQVGPKQQAMSDPAAIEQATRRLTQALDALDAAVERQAETAGARVALADQVHVLDTDRARLASELDVQTARSRNLESANRDIARRLDAAMENIRLVLESQD